MTTVLTPQEKLNVIELIESKGIDSNKVVASTLGYSANQVKAVRIWLNKKGELYKTEIKTQIAEAEKQLKLVNSLYSELANDFKNVAGKGKKEARQIMVNHIGISAKGGLRKGTIATLPSNTWAIENLIDTQVSKRFTYLACERESDVFVDMVAKMNQYGKNNKPHLGSLSEVIYDAKENEFDHIIADYCGVLSSFKDELIHACLNKVVKVGGTISVTTLKARNNYDFTGKLNNFASELSGKNIKNNNNENAIKMFFKSLTAITNFEVVEQFCYNDTTPMMLVVLKRAK